MRKRTMLLPLVLCGCLVMTACTALNGQETDEVSVVERKYPVTVEEAAEKAAEELATKKVEIAKAVTVTPKPTKKPTATPTPTPVEETTSEPEESTISAESTTNDEEGATFDAEETTIYEEPVAPVVEEPGCTDYYGEEVQYGNYYEDYTDVPQQSYDAGMQLLGTYYVTHYSMEGCGNNIGAAGVPGGMVEGISIAMPEYWMLGHWVYVDGYGQFRVDDISPSGIADIFHWYAADAVGADYRAVYLVG